MFRACAAVIRAGLLCVLVFCLSILFFLLSARLATRYTIPQCSAGPLTTRHTASPLPCKFACKCGKGDAHNTRAHQSCNRQRGKYSATRQAFFPLPTPTSIMPKVARTQRSSRSAAPDASTSAGAPLVAGCSRHALEALVLHSLEAGTPVTLEAIEAAARPPVCDTATLVPSSGSIDDAGLFSLLPFDVLVEVISYVRPFTLQLSLAIVVCKSLRALRTASPLFTSLRMPLQEAYNSYEEVQWVSGPGLLRLTKWLDPARLREVQLHLSKGGLSFRPEHVAAVLSLCSNVDTLHVTGGAVNKKVLEVMSKVAWPKLRTCMLECTPNMGHGALLSALRGAPNLTSFSIGQLTRPLIDGLSSQLREARGGGAPLLSRLSQFDTYADKINIQTILFLHTRFPELTDLHTNLDLRGPDPVLSTHSLNCTNLRRLCIYRMISFSADHLSSEVLAELVQLLLRHCSRLEALTLVHGIKYTTRTGTIPDFPRLGSSFSRVQLPKSLRLLHLEDIVVDESCFATCDLPELCLLRLINCGDQAMDAAHELVRRCPKLNLEGCVVPTAEDPLPKLDSNTPVTTRAKIHQFPLSDVSSLSFKELLGALTSNVYSRLK